MNTTTKHIRVAVVGLGGMGSRWAQVAQVTKGSQLRGVADADFAKAKAKAAELGCALYETWEDILKDKDVDAVAIATPHVFLTKIAQAALAAGKHVFTEKPGGISSRDIQKGVDIATRKKLRYRVNFNMRLHPAVALAKKKIDRGEIGELMFMRGVYAHGAREGFEREWWCNKNISGGGEMIDQGSHLIDLANWFLGPFTSVSAVLESAYWKIAPLEDNAFLLLQNKQGKVASLHASWTHWQKMFRIELYGTEGYLVAQGLGGQYGLEKLFHGKRVFGRKAPPEKVFKFPSEPGKPDVALKNSWKEFVQAIREGKDIGPTAQDAVRALRIIERGYKQSKSKKR